MVINLRMVPTIEYLRHSARVLRVVGRNQDELEVARVVEGRTVLGLPIAELAGF